MRCMFDAFKTVWKCNYVCVRMCEIRLLDWANPLPHCVHTYGLSPVCVRMCEIRLLDWANPLSHLLHTYIGLAFNRGVHVSCQASALKKAFTTKVLSCKAAHVSCRGARFVCCRYIHLEIEMKDKTNILSTQRYLPYRPNTYTYIHIVGDQCAMNQDDRSLWVHFFILCMTNGIGLRFNNFAGYKLLNAPLRLHLAKTKCPPRKSVKWIDKH